MYCCVGITYVIWTRYVEVRAYLDMIIIGP